MIRELRRRHVARFGAPVLTHVDPAIFGPTYHARCMECSFCDDQCCSYGVDVDLPNVKRIEAMAAEIEAFTGVPRDRFFTGELEVDAEYPGGGCTRTRADEGGCVFKTRGGRGCKLHAFALAKGLDYHEVKPMMSSLFPLTFSEGCLSTAIEVDEGSLACLGDGPTIYRGGRDELGWYFGAELLEELDALELARKSLRHG